jgi:hypothetical protein
MNDKRQTRSRAERRETEWNAGAFLGPDMLLPVPMRTLSDDYRDEPTDPEEEPEPPPQPPGLFSRVVDWLTRRGRPGD